MRSFYLPTRLSRIDRDFLEFEEEMASQEDLQQVLKLTSIEYRPNAIFSHNPNNSVLLFVTGLTDEFDWEKARANTVGGSPPDIDIDFGSTDRSKATQWVINHWGRDNVANIVTHGTLKPKSLTRRFFKVTEGDPMLMREILKKIPEAKFGKEATMEEMIEGNSDKNYRPQPELRTDLRYKEWTDTAEKLENLTANFGIHAAGMVISDFPISDLIPLWAKTDTEMQPDGRNKKVRKWVTQYDMHECEELGLIKFDFLAIDNLSIIKECIRLIKKHKNQVIDPYGIEDGDVKAYNLMHQGLLTGVFQMETSGSAKQLISAIKPMSIEELSDINALNRPGPMSAGLDTQYIENKANGYAPSDMPPKMAELLKGTYWTLVYQEQVMNICSELAGFTLREADDVRRAMGKKKRDVLNAKEPQFREGCEKYGISKSYATELWETLIGFADYCFNKSHSVCYSVITYTCAWLKAHYPAEFFCALMTTRSQGMQPKLWAAKAPEYLYEARQMGIQINAPLINESAIGFTIQNEEVYFGLNAIRDVGKTAARSIVAARKKSPFNDIFNFLTRVDRRKVTRKVFRALVIAGAFDRMGYSRDELIELEGDLYKYMASLDSYGEALARVQKREKEINRLEILITERDALRKLHKASQRKRSPGPELSFQEQDRLKELEDMKLRRKTSLKMPEDPEDIKPSVPRYPKLRLTVKHLLSQAEMIGCFPGHHPARILFPDTDPIKNAEIDQWMQVSGMVNNIKVITTKRGQLMAFMEIGDGTGIAEIVVFPSSYAKLRDTNRIPSTGDMVVIEGKCETLDPVTKLIGNKIAKYQGSIT